MIKENEFYIVRGNNSGLFIGEMVSQMGQEVTLKNARRLWGWDGATETLQLAVEGVKNAKNCKFTLMIDEITILDAIQLPPCTKEAEKNLKAVAVWKI